MNIYCDKKTSVIRIRNYEDYNIYGSDNDNCFLKKLIILDHIKTHKTINIRNLSIENIYFYSYSSKINLENCKIKNILLTSSSFNLLTIGDNTCIDNISIESKKHTTIDFKSKISNINNITINKSMDKKYIPDIFLFGNFKDCNLKINSNISLTCGNFHIFNPIKIDIKSSYNNSIKLGGNFNKAQIDILNCKYIRGDTINIPENVLIIIHPKISFSNIVFDGNLKNCNIKTKNKGIITLKSFFIKKFIVDENSEITLYSKTNTIFKLLGIKGSLKLDGSYACVKNLLTQCILLKDRALLSINSNNLDLLPLKPMLPCINNLLKYFIEEKSETLTLNQIKCNCIDPNINLNIYKLIKLNPYSNMFNLNERKDMLLYSEKEPNISNPDSHIFILIFKIYYKDLYFYKSVILKAKYLYLQIDYESHQCIIENNINTLNYVFNQNWINNIKLKENINITNFSLNINRRNLIIDLNNNSFLLNNIVISDSKTVIKNGTIYLNSIDLWNKHTRNDITNKSFVKVFSTNLKSILKCLNIKILDFSYNVKLSPSDNIFLFYIGDSTSSNMIDFKLKNSIISINNNTMNNYYLINTFAKNNYIYNNSFYGFKNFIKIQSLDNCSYCNSYLSENDFSKSIENNTNILELIPFKNSKGININDEKIPSDLDKKEMKKILLQIGYSLTEGSTKTKPNIINKGSRIKLYKNQYCISYVILIYDGISWVEKLIPPVLSPDTTYNDMSHVIIITFPPDKVWVNGLISIEIINSSTHLLKNNEYHIDNNLGKLSIKNVILNEYEIPLYQGLLEPGINKIIIKSKNYDTAKTIQIIKAIQIVEFKNGIGKAITRINKEGINHIKASLISNKEKIDLGSPIKVDINPN
ncbi:hemoblobin-interacting domain-containing protein [Clostridium oceanicum]|uniref:Heme-binding protein Shr-like Hb-interacting domain-containing protein n=1 Tax=Clostridium oceanicum TaxID=1543 RepID=A0ABN1JHX0_9CLOT